MTILLYTVHVLICFFLIAVVLLQQGSGADLSVFGGGATQTAFGARGAATVLHKMTVVSFVLFIITTLAIGVVHTKSVDSSVLGDLPGAEEVEATAEDGADSSGEAAAEEAEEDVQGALPVDEGTADDADTADDAGSEDAAPEVGTDAGANPDADPDAESGADAGDDTDG